MTLQELYSIGDIQHSPDLRRFLYAQDPVLYENLNVDPPRNPKLAIYESISNDDIFSLKEMMKEPDFAPVYFLSDIELTSLGYSSSPVWDTFRAYRVRPRIIQGISLFAHSCFSGALKCFRHLLINGGVVTEECCEMAFKGQNEEIIQICLEHYPEPKWLECFYYSIQVHNYNQIDWILSQGLKIPKLQTPWTSDFRTFEVISKYQLVLFDFPETLFTSTISWLEFAVSKVTKQVKIDIFINLVSHPSASYPIIMYILDKYPGIWQPQCDLKRLEQGRTLEMVKKMYEHGIRFVGKVRRVFYKREGVLIWDFLETNKLSHEIDLIKALKPRLEIHYVHFDCYPFLKQYIGTPRIGNSDNEYPSLTELYYKKTSKVPNKKPTVDYPCIK